MNIESEVDVWRRRLPRCALALSTMWAGLKLALLSFLLVASPGLVAAETADSHLEKVRDIEADDLVEDVLGAKGAAFAPGVDAYIAPDDSAAGAATLNVFKPSRKGKRPRGTRRGKMATLPVSDPINLTVDGQMMGAKGAGLFRLFLFQPRQQQLVAIRLGADGTAMRKPVTFDASQYGVEDAQGIAFDPKERSLFILDNAGPEIIRIDSARGRKFGGKKAEKEGRISRISMGADQGQVRGIAFQPITRHLFVLSESNQSLDEFTLEGELVTRHSLAGSGLKHPMTMVFAPSLDRTDAADIYHLYTVAQRGGVLVTSEFRLSASTAQSAAPNAFVARSSGSSVFASLIQAYLNVMFKTANAASGPDVVATLIQTIDTSAFSPPSPDPAGAVYLPFSNTLLFNDSEVNEIPALFTGKNLYEMNLSGQLLGTHSTLAYSMEPTGIDLNPANQHLFISDDDRDRINEIDPGNDGQYDTADDIVTWFSTRPFGGNDPEDVAFSPSENALFILDGFNAEVYRLTPGPNGKFDGIPPGGDDQVTQFDTESLGLTNPEGIVFEPDTGLLYLVGDQDDRLFHVTTTGALVRIVDIAHVDPRKPAGLALGPGSLGNADPNAGALNVYMTARGVDNDFDPDENDGRLYELSVPPLPPQGGTNIAPTVSAGPDQTIALPAGATLDGTATDDGLPNPPSQLTVNWAKVSGPGDVTFGNPADANTSALFSGPGAYVLRLTADDNELSSSDEVGVTVEPATPSSVIQTIYVSTRIGGSVGGVNMADEDILAFDVATGTWSIFFDGSDVGLGGSGTELDAFNINPDGSILLSFNVSVSVPGVGTISDADIVRFLPTSIGTNTAGSFQMYFHGADVGLTSSSGDIDTIAFAPDGRLILSTTGSIDVPGVTRARDEDLLAFTATQLGSTTSGTFARYFDGSDVQLSDGGENEDLKGAWIDTNGEIYLSAAGNFSVPGASGAAADIFVCTPGAVGASTSCSFRPFFDGAQNGLSGRRLGGIYLAR